jgi:sugar O-acyltransferase (sialic acid O-acetyltransferase NeuD family)
MTRILILGAGGHSKVVAETAQLCGYSCIQHLDDAYSHRNSSYPDTSSILPVGPLSCALEPDFRSRFRYTFVALGNPYVRSGWIKALQDYGYSLPVLIHPSAYVSPSAQIGIGSLIAANSTIQPSVKAGIGFIANTASTVDHDCSLGDYVHVAPGAHLAGTVTVGDSTLIGIGSSTIQNINIGAHCIIGAGAVVISDIPSDSTAVGVPARVLPAPAQSF